MNTHRKIGMGLVGPGFIAPHHIDAVRRLGNVSVVAIAGSSQDSAVRKAAQFGVEKAYGDYMQLLEDPAVEVVHNTTPSYLHYEVSLAALRAGKHVISDKRLAINPAERRELCDAAEQANVVNAVTFSPLHPQSPDRGTTSAVRCARSRRSPCVRSKSVRVSIAL